MKINNLFDDNYNYEFIDKMRFDNKYLSCNTDGSKYKKYLLVCYKEDDVVKYKDIPDESYLDKINNVMKVYNVEEIISSCIYFDGMYSKLNYFHVDDIYFIKYIFNEECKDLFEANNDYEKIKDELDFNDYE